MAPSGKGDERDLRMIRAHHTDGVDAYLDSHDVVQRHVANLLKIVQIGTDLAIGTER